MTRLDRTTRIRLALLLAICAVAAAAFAARGPAVDEQAEYSWPPAELPAASPSRTWFTPMLLARHAPKALDARLPCGPARALPGAGRRIVLLATARDVPRWNALEVTRMATSRKTVVRVGSVELATIAATGAARGCSLHFHLDGLRWTLSQTGGPTRHGELGSAPGVAGLITELDLRARTGVSVTVRPLPQDTRPSEAQTALRVLAGALLAAAVLLLLSIRRRRFRSFRGPGLAAQDAQVGLVLMVWWLLAPLQDDDGWVRARQTNSLASGGFSNYYEHWGANLPLATWLEWLQHFLVAHTTSLALHRLPSMVLMAATWYVCRLSLTRRLGSPPRRDDATWWAASLSFSVGAVAFGNTLRPEPAIALLAATVLGLCLAYLAKPAVGLLVAAVLLCGLAITVHPSGVIAAAPLVICLPRIVRDARERNAIDATQLAVVAVVATAWTVLLAFMDSDVDNRETSATLIRSAGGHSDGIFQELQRYGRLGEPGASPLRRLFVGLLLLVALASVAALIRRRRSLASRLPSASVALSLVFLSVTPSKWIWHFGALVGVAAVAVGVETGRWSSLRISSRARAAAAAAVLLVALAAGIKANHWGPLDVGRLDWSVTPALYVLGAVAAFAAALAAAHVGRVRHSAVVVLPAVLASTIAVTVLTFAADAVATSGWTPARQAGASLIGRDGCGVAADILAETPARDPTEGPAAGRRTLRVPSFAAHRPPEPAELDRTGATPWYPVARERIGVFVTGRWQHGDTLTVTWGRRGTSHVRPLVRGEADFLQSSEGPDFARWRFVAESSFPARPPTADSVRFRLTPSSDASSARVTSPTTARRLPLAEVLQRDGSRTLVSPFLFEAMPCTRLPELAYGVATTPNVLVDWVPVPSLTNTTSPWAGISEVFDLDRIPVTTTVDRGPLFVYTVRPDARDAVAPATRSILG